MSKARASLTKGHSFLPDTFISGMSHSAFTPQPPNVVASWLVLRARVAEDRRVR